jgi:hypothetical protein
VTFGYLSILYVRVCEINDPGQTCDEYLILLTKLGMTREHRRWTLRQTGPGTRITEEASGGAPGRRHTKDLPGGAPGRRRREDLREGTPVPVVADSTCDLGQVHEKTQERENP